MFFNKLQLENEEALTKLKKYIGEHKLLYFFVFFCCCDFQSVWAISETVFTKNSGSQPGGNSPL